MEPATSKPQLAPQSPEQPLLTYSPDLTRRVADFANASSLAARNVALIRLVHWTRRSDKIQNLAALIEYLEHDEPMRARFQESFARMLQELRSLSLFAEAGIPYDHSLMAEITQRVAGRLVPSAREDTDTSKLLIALYSSEREVHRFLQTPDELYRRLVAVLAPPDAPGVWSHQRTDLQDALRLLASRVSGRGLEPEMRDRSSPLPISESPFYRIGAATDALIAASDESNVLACLSKWTETASRCRWEMVQVHRHMESAGVSVELIFDLKKIEACLNRMEMIVEVLVASTPAHQVMASRTLMFHLMEGRIADRSLRLLLRDNLNLIARKMVERTGRSGEHYIAHDRAEYWHMWRAALGGGLLTVITAAFKLRIVDAHLPPFAEGFLAGTNYAVSFVLLQILGLVLATKQPAATAATFAGIIRDNKGVERSSKLTDFVAHITSTQLAAAIGNVSAVTVGAIAFEWLWTKVFGGSYLPPESATHVYETLHPFASGTAVYRHHHWRDFVDGCAGRRMVRKLRGLLPARRCDRAASPGIARGREMDEASGRCARSKSRRLEHQHRAGIFAGIHAGDWPLLRHTSRCAARDLIHWHAGPGGREFWNAEPGPRVVLFRSGGHCRHLRPEPGSEFYDRGVCCTARLRREACRAVASVAFPGGGRD